VQSGFQGHYKALVSIEQTDGSPLTEDWVLQVGLAQRHAPVARIQKYNDSYVAMVALHPEMDEENVHSEIIFVVDRSGSMQGSKMKSGKERPIIDRTIDSSIYSATNIGVLFEIVA
jgi:Mg-chelatase subunit ChlD